MLHIAFINPYESLSPYQASLPPLGIGYLSAFLKQHFGWVKTSFHHTVEQLIDAKPDLVGISSASENFLDAMYIAERVKEELGVPIVVGGMHITSLPHTLPKTMDVGVVGEGEGTFMAVVELYHAKSSPGPEDFAKINGISYHDNGAVAVNPGAEMIKEMDTLPYPDRDLIDHGWRVPNWETVHLVSSRGCPYKCSFCSSSLHWKRFRFFSPEYVAKEIEYLRERYNPEILYFFDDLFVGHIGRWREVVKLFQERGLHRGVHFRAYARVDLVTAQMAEEFAELNFKYIDFGFESNSEPILKFLTKTRVTPEVNQRAIDMLYKNQVSVGANFIIGSPPETIEDIQQSIAFARANRDAIDRCSVGPLQPLPGTAIWNIAKMKGLVNDNFEWSRLATTYETFDWETFPFMGENMTRKEFWDSWTEFNQLAKEINYVGQMRRLTMQRSQRDNRIADLERQLAELKGSRIIQAASKVRDWRRKTLAVEQPAGASA
ncbi:MAG: radical SAM protein [Candidatus Sumerlaeia bacterium]|nr:radical SAM protein [Candidatus Sumerlaeia bacterium]